MNVEHRTSNAEHRTVESLRSTVRLGSRDKYSMFANILLLLQTLSHKMTVRSATTVRR